MEQQKGEGEILQKKTPGETGNSWVNEYYEAAKAGFFRIWNNRFLWFWGFFLPVGMGGGFNYNLGPEEKTMEGRGNVDFASAMEQFGNYVDENLTWFVVGFLTFIFLGVIFWTISAIARMGVTKALEQLQNPATSLTYNFKEVWNRGKVGFGRIMILDLVIGLVLLLVGLLLALPMVVLLTKGQFGALVFLGILAFLIYLPITILAYFLKTSGVIIHVVSNATIRGSIEIAYEYVSANLKEALKLVLTFLVMGILHWVIVLSVVVSVVIVGAIIAFFFFVVFGLQAIADSGLVLLAIIVAVALLVLFIALLFIVKAFFSVWTWDIWVWWTKKLGATSSKNKIKNFELAGNDMKQEISPTADN